MDHYEVLGVSRSAPPNVIRAAYAALVREHHPDLTGAAGTQVMQQLNEARAVLLDDARRRAYDTDLDARQSDASSPSAPAEPGSSAQGDHTGDWGAEDVIPPTADHGPFSWGPRGAAGGSGFGPGATPMPQGTPAPAEPPLYRGATAAYAPWGGETAWSIATGRTRVQTVSGLCFGVLNLVLIIIAVVTGLTQHQDGGLLNVAIWGLMVWAAASGALVRVRTGRFAKRYVLLVIFWGLVATSGGGGAVLGLVWTVLFVMAVESRRWGRTA